MPDCIEVRAIVAANPEFARLVSEPLVAYPAWDRLVIQRPLQSLDLNPLTALSDVNTRVLSAQPHRIIRSGYAVDDSTPNRQYRELWPKIIRKTNWSSRSGSRPTRLAGSISNDFGGRR